MLGLVFCLLVRLLPFRAPNVEPILATQMPYAKAYGASVGFLFGFLSIVSYDVITHTLGIWTLFTASTYGTLGLCAAYFFRTRKASVSNFIAFSILGTLFFDLMTGLSIGPIFFHQSFYNAFFGQIPFTALHLTGNVAFSLILSPAIYVLVGEKKNLKFNFASV